MQQVPYTASVRPSFYSAIAAAIILTSCTASQQVETLKPTDILSRSVLTNAQIQSVHIDAHVTYDKKSTVSEKDDVQFSINAVDQFRSLAGTGMIVRRITSTQLVKELRIGGDVILDAGSVWYVRIRQFDNKNWNDDLASLSASLNLWLSIQQPAKTNVPTPPVTIDPTILSQILGAVIVDSDDGIVTINNSKQYHYHIHIVANPSNGITTSISGEVWIDAQTFYLTRALWKIQNQKTSTGTQSSTTDIRLSQQDESLPVAVPNHFVEASAPTVSMFHTILPSALLPE